MSTYQAVQRFYDLVGSLNAVGSVALSVKKPALLLTLEDRVEPGNSGYINAFDVVTTPYARNAAIDRLTSLPSFSGFSTAVRDGLGYIEKIPLDNRVIGIPVRIRDQIILSDGSSFVVEFNFSTEEYEYEKGSAKDAVGNPIPEDAIAATGGPNSTQKYYYPATAEGFDAGLRGRHHFQEMGMDVPVSFTGSGPWVVGCSSVASEPPHCYAISGF